MNTRLSVTWGLIDAYVGASNAKGEASEDLAQRATDAPNNEKDATVSEENVPSSRLSKGWSALYAGRRLAR